MCSTSESENKNISHYTNSLSLVQPDVATPYQSVLQESGVVFTLAKNALPNQGIRRSESYWFLALMSLLAR